jgi:L-iditol 2-dehydrogenase
MPVITGRAAVVREYGQPFEMVEYPVPDPEPGALVVAVDVTTICGSDVHAWEGAYEGILPVERPLILGHEVVGKIVAIGPGAELDSMGRELKVGDRVVWAHESCGHCWECTVSGQPTLCRERRLGMLSNSDVPPHFAGTFAQYSYVWPKAGRLRVPDELKSEWASAASCALRTVVNAVELAGRVGHLDNVVIQGAGPVGLFCAAVTSTHSPKRVIVIGAPDDRLEIARSWGADQTISIETHDRAGRLAAVMSMTDGRGADILFEASGVPSAVSEGLTMSARCGRYVLIGTTGRGTVEIEPHYVVNRGLSILGSFSGGIDSYFKAMEFMVRHRHRFNWDDIIGARYPLQDITEALRSMRAHEDIKPVVVPGPAVGP